MKRFLIKLGVFLAIQIAAVVWLVPHLWTGDPNNYFAALGDKAALLARGSEQNRIILVGGSNTAWGLSAKDLGGKLGRPVINTGISAALGLDVILDFPAAYLRPGDVVVLSLEYEQYDEDTRHDDTIWAATPYLKGLPIRVASLQPVYIADRFLQYVGVARDHLSNLNNPKLQEENKLYSRDSFNERGDMIAHYGLPSPVNVADLHIDMGRLEPDVMAPYVEKINRFITTAETAGAKVYIYYPPLPEKKYGIYKAQLTTLDAYLEKNLHCPILNRPGELILADSDMYNTIYHLTKPGVDKRTADLAVHLQKALSTGDGKNRK